ncbi:Hypothetical_protein [Hexamita inflata]|uniref:Hypothetical_protein n=1 Tax=Hexamita inflata TaxID=28002 RepID=A0AA86RCX5_9EUKA|nr:Hypothetical protein HINF_LOCUS62900 [Hexamita inflata]
MLSVQMWPNCSLLLIKIRKWRSTYLISELSAPRISPNAPPCRSLILICSPRSSRSGAGDEARVLFLLLNVVLSGLNDRFQHELQNSFISAYIFVFCTIFTLALNNFCRLLVFLNLMIICWALNWY